MVACEIIIVIPHTSNYYSNTTSLAEDSIEEELNYEEGFESYDSFVTEGSGGR
jgi:hypothetical protein